MKSHELESLVLVAVAVLCSGVSLYFTSFALKKEPSIPRTTDDYLLSQMPVAYSQVFSQAETDPSRSLVYVFTPPNSSLVVPLAALQGEEGVIGETGQNGLPGTNGSSGQAGQSGTQGPPGPRGTQGAPCRNYFDTFNATRCLQGCCLTQQVRGVRHCRSKTVTLFYPEFSCFLASGSAYDAVFPLSTSQVVPLEFRTASNHYFATFIYRTPKMVVNTFTGFMMTSPALTGTRFVSRVYDDLYVNVPLTWVAANLTTSVFELGAVTATYEPTYDVEFVL